MADSVYKYQYATSLTHELCAFLVQRMPSIGHRNALHVLTIDMNSELVGSLT